MPSVVEVLPSSDDDEVYASSSPQPKTQASTTDAAGAADKEMPEPAAPVPIEESESDDEAEPVVDLDKCLRLKNAGNALFVKNDVSGALQQYRRAMRYAPLKPRTSALPPSDADKAQNEADAKASEAPNAEAEAPAPADAAPADAAPAEDSPAPPAQEEDTTDYTLTAQVYCNAGLCLTKLDLREDAVESLTEAIRHDNAYQKAYLRRAECYYDLSKWSSAYADYDSYTKLGGQLDAGGRAKMADSKTKMEAEMQKMLGDLKDVGNKFLGLFGLSTENFKFDKDPSSGGYSVRFER